MRFKPKGASEIFEGASEIFEVWICISEEDSFHGFVSVIAIVET